MEISNICNAFFCIVDTRSCFQSEGYRISCYCVDLAAVELLNKATVLERGVDATGVAKFTIDLSNAFLAALWLLKLPIGMQRSTWSPEYLQEASSLWMANVGSNNNKKKLCSISHLFIFSLSHPLARPLSFSVSLYIYLSQTHKHT